MIRLRAPLTSALIAAAAIIPAFTDASAGSFGNNSPTATPIKHLVVIFQENVSFDHYFATYPVAANPSGEPRFFADPRTPSVNGLTGALLANNPNAVNTAVNGAGATNPFRLDRSEAATADQDHDYTPEQLAFDHGLMDAFPASVGTAGPPPDRHADRAHHGSHDGLLRRQHRHSLLELCAAVCDERQLVRHELRTVHRRRREFDLRAVERCDHGSEFRAARPSATVRAA